MSAVNTLCWVDIPVLDLDRAIGFYSAILGATVAKETHGPDFAFGLLPHADQNASGCLVVGPEHRPSADGPLIYLNVNGRLDDAIQAARAHGGKVLKEREAIGPFGHRAIIADLEGNRIALHSH